MTIFNVIRYPISSPPTLAELEALPLDVYARWVRKTFHIGGIGKVSTPDQVHSLLSRVHSDDTEFWESYIEDLRTMISRLRR